MKYFRLLSVPFDNTYKKVFNFNSIPIPMADRRELATNIHSILLRKYKNLNLQISNREFKRKSNIGMITVNQNYIIVKDYNYLVYFDDIYGYIFNFITDIVSNNNGNNPSTTIYFEQDVWLNNLYNIYDFSTTTVKPKITNIETITQSHKKRYYTIQNNDYYKQYNIGLENLPVNKEEEKYTGFLYLKLTLSDEYINSKNHTESRITFDGVTQNYIGVKFTIANTNKFKNVIYIPLGFMVNGVYRKVQVRAIGTGIATYATGTYSETITGSIQATEYYDLSIPNLADIDSIKIIETLSSYIVNSELTFNCPYSYIRNGNQISFNALGSGFGIFHYIPDYLALGITALDFTYDNKSYYVIHIKELSGVQIQDNIVKTIPFRDKFILDTQAKNINSTENYEIESVTHYYPFKYHSIYYNNYEKELKFAPDNEINKILQIKVDNGQFYFDIYNETPGHIFLTTGKQLTYSKDALQEYLIRNGSQEKVAFNFEILNKAISMLNINSTVPNLMGIHQAYLSLDAKHSDLDSTPSSVISSSYAEDDIYIQDRIIHYTNNAMKNKKFNDLMNFYYIYGYNSEEMDEVFEDKRFWFDYKKTIDCNLSNTLYPEDKKIIENMLNNGVHIFHINYLNDTLYFNSTMEFDHKNNIERELATV